MPDCQNQHESSATCPFIELYNKLSCQAANKILSVSPKCKNLRPCCEKTKLLNNGICDSEISDDFNCKYDVVDCQDEQKKMELCQYAEEQSKLSCGIQNEVESNIFHSNKVAEICKNSQRLAQTCRDLLWPIMTSKSWK